MNELPNILQFNPVGAYMQGQQFQQGQQSAAQENQLRAMQLQQAQQGMQRDQQFRNELATYLQGGSGNLAALYAADPERAMQVRQFQVQQNQLARQKRVEDAKRNYATAQYVLQSKSPKALAESQLPQLIQQLKESGVDWDSMTDDDVRGLAEQVAARSGSQAGILPERVDADTTARIEAESKSREDQQAFEADQTRQKQKFEADQARLKREGEASKPEKAFENATTLRKEYDSQSKDFQTATQGYQSVLSASRDPSAAGDLALIFSYMKTLDPGSTVREGEFANAQNAGGIPARVTAQYNKILKGERLAPEQRSDFVKKAGQLYEGQKGLDDKRRERYRKIAESNGLNASDVLGDQVRVDIPPAALNVGQSTQLSGFTIKRKK